MQKISYFKIISWSIAILVLLFLALLYISIHPPFFQDSDNKEIISFDQIQESEESENQYDSVSNANEIINNIMNFDSSSASPEKIYIVYCAACHGIDGRANTKLSKRMYMRPTNLVSGPFKFPSVSIIIKNGVGLMPGYEKYLDKEKINELAIYVLQFRRQKKQNIE